MNRIRLLTNLPPLADLMLGFAGLTATPTRSHALHAQLRRLIIRLRGRQPRRFYSTREVARFFMVAPELARRAFGELQREGLLTRVRSSMTVITPQHKQPRATVRGVVGLPVWHNGYCSLSTWREFHVRLEDELRRRHYVADLIFFDKNAPNLPHFRETLLNHDLDYLVWYLPIGADAEVMLMLGDCGVTPIVVQEGAPFYPAAEYIIDWLPALAAALQDWRHSGVTALDVLTSWLMLIGSDKLMTGVGIPFRILDAEHFRPLERFEKYVRGMKPDPTKGVITLENLWNSQMITRFPMAFPELLRKRRVLIRDRIDLDPADTDGLTVDILSSNLPKLAARIADDIASGRLPEQGQPVILPATYRPQVPVKTCALFY